MSQDNHRYQKLIKIIIFLIPIIIIYSILCAFIPEVMLDNPVMCHISSPHILDASVDDLNFDFHKKEDRNRSDKFTQKFARVIRHRVSCQCDSTDGDKHHVEFALNGLTGQVKVINASACEREALESFPFQKHIRFNKIKKTEYEWSSRFTAISTETISDDEFNAL